MEYEILHEVSNLDREIIKFKREINNKETLKKLKICRKEYEVLKFEYNKKANEENDINKRINRLNLEVEEKNLKIKEFENKLYNSTNLKTIEVCQNTINNLNLEIKTLEDTIYKLITKSESIKVIQSEANKKLKKIRESYNTGVIEYKKNREELSALLNEAVARRNNLMNGVRDEIRDTYEEITKTMGYGMSEVKEEICLGCGRDVPVVIINSVRNTKELTKCPNCGRYIYLINK